MVDPTLPVAAFSSAFDALARQAEQERQDRMHAREVDARLSALRISAEDRSSERMHERRLSRMQAKYELEMSKAQFETQDRMHEREIDARMSEIASHERTSVTQIKAQSDLISKLNDLQFNLKTAKLDFIKETFYSTRDLLHSYHDHLLESERIYAQNEHTSEGRKAERATRNLRETRSALHEVLNAQSKLSTCYANLMMLFEPDDEA